MVIRNNGSTAKGSASELGQPTENGAALANFDAKVGNNSGRAKRLGELFAEIGKNGRLGAHQLLHGLNVALDTSVTVEQGMTKSTDRSRYHDLDNGVFLRSDFVGSDEIANFANELKNTLLYGKRGRQEKTGDRLQQTLAGERAEVGLGGLGHSQRKVEPSSGNG